jgi:endonuclease VIII
MPEGDTVYRAAAHLDEVLRGQVLTRCDIRVPAFATVDLGGRRVDEVVARGKHLLHRIGDTTIHTHLKMEGSWHRYRHGTRWRRPAHTARIVLETADWVTVGFSLGVVELVARDREDDVVGYLGPDILGADWDRAEAVRRLTADPERPVGLALLDQRVIAGLGNVYRNEVLFLRGVRPTRPVGEVADPEAMVALSERLIRANRDRTERSTTGDLRPGRRAWVSHREGKRCLRCGTPIQQGALGEDELTERQTFFCPVCQS